MRETTLFVTGRLAEQRLRAVLATLPADFEYEIWNAGVKVAALITEQILLRRLPRPVTASRVILPGRCRADLSRLSTEFGAHFERGPGELKDLPSYLGTKGGKVDLSNHDLRIFSEIVDASTMSLDALELRAVEMSLAGADVIDIGCLPDTPFPHLENAVRRLKAIGLNVSVDSANTDELARAASAGADFLLSLNEFTLGISGNSRPVLVPATSGNLDSLIRAYDQAKARGIDPILDPILDPIHFGFTDSLMRYRELRHRLPEVEIMMGTGNLTELTDVDTAGVTAILLGICSELNVKNALTVHVSPHTRRTIQEHDAARRLMYAAKRERSLPRGFGDSLLQIHDRDPFLNDDEGLAATVLAAKDASFRIEISSDGIHIFNRDFHFTDLSAAAIFNRLPVEIDSSHALYLGSELQKAEIAFQLGKRYVQDEPIDWNIAVDLMKYSKISYSTTDSASEIANRPLL